MYRENLLYVFLWKTFIIFVIFFSIFLLIYSSIKKDNTFTFETTENINQEVTYSYCLSEEDLFNRAASDINKKFYFDDHRKEFYEGAGGYRTEFTPLGERTNKMQIDLKEALDNKDFDEIMKIYGLD